RKLMAVVMATIAVALAMAGLAGWALNERTEAKQHLENVQRRQSAQARSFYQIGLLEFESGKKGDGVNWVLHALETAPSDDPFRSSYHRLLQVLMQGLPITLPHEGWVHSASFSPDGRLVVTASRDGARLWESSTGKQIATLPHEGEKSFEPLLSSAS